MDLRERAEAGKAARGRVARLEHAEWEPSGGRRDPVEILEEQAATRVRELVPIRYARMSASPFAFFRGAAAVMAADLAETPTSGLRVQACGDAHLSNFGLFAAPDRRLVFDLNDFDETLPAPWEWDLKRLAASFAVAGRENGFRRKARLDVAQTVGRAYREAMRGFARMPFLEVWYARLDTDSLLPALRREAGDKKAGRAAVARVERGVAKARLKDNLRALARLTQRVDGELRIVSDPPLLVPVEEMTPAGDSHDLEARLLEIVAAYRSSLPVDRRQLFDRYRFRHLARKVVGVGSVGTRAWVALFTGADDRDALFLQAKEAQASVLEPFAGRGRFDNEGRRVVEGQRLMQATGDIFLGWCPAVGFDGRERHFYLRQLWDWKRSAEIETMTPKAMGIYARMCGWTLARAHARSGDAVAVGAYLGRGESFDRALASFAELYADQNERDHATLVAAIESGGIEAGEA